VYKAKFASVEFPSWRLIKVFFGTTHQRAYLVIFRLPPVDDAPVPLDPDSFELWWEDESRIFNIMPTGKPKKHRLTYSMAHKRFFTRARQSGISLDFLTAYNNAMIQAKPQQDAEAHLTQAQQSGQQHGDALEDSPGVSPPDFSDGSFEELPGDDRSESGRQSCQEPPHLEPSERSMDWLGPILSSSDFAHWQHLPLVIAGSDTSLDGGADRDDFHHLNYLDMAMQVPSSTPPEVSLWAVLSPRLVHWNSSHGLAAMRKVLLATRASRWIDPFCYYGPGEVLERSGTALREGVTGWVTKCYQGYGNWTQDARGPDDDEVIMATGTEQEFINWQVHDTTLRQSYIERVVRADPKVNPELVNVPYEYLVNKSLPSFGREFDEPDTRCNGPACGTSNKSPPIRKPSKLRQVMHADDIEEVSQSEWSDGDWISDSPELSSCADGMSHNSFCLQPADVNSIEGYWQATLPGYGTQDLPERRASEPLMIEMMTVSRMSQLVVDTPTVSSLAKSPEPRQGWRK